jgi:hypothetical protein
LEKKIERNILKENPKLEKLILEFFHISSKEEVIEHLFKF